MIFAGFDFFSLVSGNMQCISYTVDLKQQNRLKAGTDKPKLKVGLQSVSDDDVRKRLLKSHVVLSWQRKGYSDWEDVTSSGRAFQVFGPATACAKTNKQTSQQTCNSFSSLLMLSAALFRDSNSAC